MTRPLLVLCLLALLVLACAMQPSHVTTLPPKANYEQAMLSVFDYHNQDRVRIHRLEAENFYRRAEGLR